MLSCAQLPLARMPTFRRSQTVPSTEPTQPSRQSAVPAGFKLAAPERPPKAPPTVQRLHVGRAAAAAGLPACAASATGAITTAPSATMTFETKRRNILSSPEDVVD